VQGAFLYLKPANMSEDQSPEQKKQKTEQQLNVVEKVMRYVIFNSRPDVHVHDLQSILCDLYNLKDTLCEEQ
jgi:hypothetical protein